MYTTSIGHWLDLANAYGSVHHQLISCCLQHYHAPPAFLDMIANLYTGLSATITSQTWSTKPVPLEIGVYQGDPLSVVIFNTVMSTLSDSLQAHRHLGYTISGTTISTNVLLYADDTCLVADGPASCQHLLTCVEQWLLWTGMAAKVPKCFSLGIQSSTAKRFDPNFQAAAERKKRRYMDLAEEAARQGYTTRILPIQMGSRGVIDESLEDLRSCLNPIPSKSWQAFLTNIAATTIQESHRIWCDRNHTS